MFNQLFKLFKRKTKKTPLEDYTTEVFVCILNQYDDIKNKFCKLLDLPDDDYIVTTQVMYRLEDDNDCIIDIQLKGIDNICFIENKVDSSEGVRQLERYSKVLDLRLEKETRLVYCTKYAEEKQIQHHNFKQFRWFEIAKFLKEFEQYIIVRDYISF